MRSFTIKTIIIFLLQLVCLTSCHSPSAEEVAGTREERLQLNLFLYGSSSEMELVLEAYQKKYQPNYDIHVEFIADLEEYKRLLQMKLAALEDLDLVHDSPQIGMQENIIQDRYKVLSDYFHNQEYPGIAEHFPESKMETNQFLHRIYGIPVSTAPDDMKGVFIRKDLREQTGYPAIGSHEELHSFLQYLQNHTDQIPLAINRSGFEPIFFDFSAWMKEGIYQVPGLPWNTFPVLVSLSEDQRQIDTLHFLGDGNIKEASTQNQYQAFSAWIPYVQEHSMVNTNALTYIIEGKAVCATGTFSQYKELSIQLKESIPHAELEFFPLSQPDQEMDRGKQVSGMSDAFLAIPVHSQKHNLVMELIERICSDEELRQQYAPSKPPIPDKKTEQYWDYQYGDNFFDQSPLSGFTFNPINVTVELGQLSLLYEKYRLILNHGTQGDAEELIHEFHQEASSLGLERLREEIRLQLNIFLQSA